MKIQNIPLHYFFIITLLAYYLLSALIAAPQVSAKEREQNISYELAISFDMKRQQVNGTAHLVIPAQR
jgi:surface polysaccharide O-acyltransferase-like enzyme